MHHTKSTLAERPPLSARFIATEWFRGVGYALVTLLTGGALYLVGGLTLEGVEALLSGRAFQSAYTLMQAVLPVAMLAAGVMGMAAVGASVLGYPWLAILFERVCRWLAVLGFTAVLIMAIHYHFFSPHHCNCLG